MHLREFKKTPIDWSIGSKNKRKQYKQKDLICWWYATTIFTVGINNYCKKDIQLLRNNEVWRRGTAKCKYIGGPNSHRFIHSIVIVHEGCWRWTQQQQKMDYLKALFMLGLCSLVAGHGRLILPAARNCMWRFGYPNPKNYDDAGLYCGGYDRQWHKNKGNWPLHGFCSFIFHHNKKFRLKKYII